MAIRSDKATGVATATATEAALSTQQIIDELGPLQEKIENITGPLKPDMERAKYLEDLLRERVPGAAGVTLSGVDYEAVVGKKNEHTEINMARVWKVLPVNTLKLIASTSAEKLKAVCTAEQLGKCITKSPTGPRTVKTFRRMAEAA